MRKVVVAGLLLAAAAPATAATIFDSQALGEPLCQHPTLYTCVTSTSVGAYLNFAAVVHFDANETVTQIGVYSAVGDAQNIEFLVFDSEYDNGSHVTGTGDVLFSQTKYFNAHGPGYIYTDPISFTFQAGKTYDIGIVGTGHSLTGRYVTAVDPDTTAINLTSGPVTEYAANANIGYYAYDPTMPDTTGIDHPFTGGYTRSAGYIQLNTGAVSVTDDVAEPATWALLIAGFGLVGSAFRRRRPVRV